MLENHRNSYGFVAMMMRSHMNSEGFSSSCSKTIGIHMVFDSDDEKPYEFIWFLRSQQIFFLPCLCMRARIHCRVRGRAEHRFLLRRKGIISTVVRFMLASTLLAYAFLTLCCRCTVPTMVLYLASGYTCLRCVLVLRIFIRLARVLKARWKRQAQSKFTGILFNNCPAKQGKQKNSD